MKHYLLSVMQPVGEPPAPEVLKEIMHNLDVLHAELREAGAWVFAGDCTARRRPPCCGPRTATC